MSQYYRFDDDEDKSPVHHEEKPGKTPPLKSPDKPAEGNKKSGFFYSLGAAVGYLILQVSGELEVDRLRSLADKTSIWELLLLIGGLVFVSIVYLRRNHEDMKDIPWCAELALGGAFVFLVMRVATYFIY